MAPFFSLAQVVKTLLNLTWLLDYNDLKTPV
jgi:hypothetical protein